MGKSRPEIDWTWYQKSEVQTAIYTCRQLLNNNIVSGAYSPEMEQAGLTFLLINLNDLLQKMRFAGSRLEFKNDIHEASGASDITELINNARNAACHLNSGKQDLANNRLAFCIIDGYFPRAMNVNGVVMGSEYDDDTAVVFGANRVYLKRHVIQALDAATEYFKATMDIRVIP